MLEQLLGGTVSFIVIGAVLWAIVKVIDPSARVERKSGLGDQSTGNTGFKKPEDVFKNPDELDY